MIAALNFWIELLFTNTGQWSNQQTGQNQAWIMYNLSPIGFPPLPTASQQGWELRGPTDFNTEGIPDLRWRRSVNPFATGANGFWQMTDRLKASGFFQSDNETLDWLMAIG